MTAQDEIKTKLIQNDSLFSNIYVMNQYFDIKPSPKRHYGACIEYQDLLELRDEFIDELYDSIVD